MILLNIMFGQWTENVSLFYLLPEANHQQRNRHHESLFLFVTVVCVTIVRFVFKGKSLPFLPISRRVVTSTLFFV